MHGLFTHIGLYIQNKIEIILRSACSNSTFSQHHSFFWNHT